MIDQSLVVANTVVHEKGDGPAVEVGLAEGRIFLLTLSVTKIVEQESIELSIFASPDGTAWGTKPLVTYAQKFYRGEYPFLLDLSGHPEARFIRAHWEVARWGRGSEIPMFEFGVSVREVPSEVLRDVAEARA